jgi:hypothetical protein
VLPAADWPVADRAVAAAWVLAKELQSSVDDRTYFPGLGLGKAHYQALTSTFRTNVGRFGEVLEKLKHGQISNDRRAVAVAEWRAWGADFERWAYAIDAAAQTGSLLGAIRDVGSASATDLLAAAQDAGKGFLALGRYLPWILAALALLFVVLKSAPWRRAS